MRELTRVYLRFQCGPSPGRCKDNIELMEQMWTYDPYKQDISTISGNILNANQNSLSSLSIEYIAYFYSVFPLHLNSFNRLFYHILYKYPYYFQFHIHYINKYLCQVKDIKFKLDSLSSHTIKLLEVLNNHLNIYKKPNDNLKSIIDSYLKILIDAIDHDTRLLTRLHNFFEHFTRNYTITARNIISYFEKFSKGTYKGEFVINQFNTQDLSKNISIHHQLENIRTKYYSFIKTHNPKSINRLNIKIKPLKKKIKRVKSSQDDYLLQIQKILKENEKYEYLKNIQKLTCITNIIKGLCQLKESIDEIMKCIVEKKASIIQNIKNTKFYLDLFKKINKNESVQDIKDNINWIYKIKEQENKIYNEYLLNSESIYILNKFITEIDSLTKYINELKFKFEITKSKLNKKTLIEYIINLIDTINFIISVEPSQILEHLKPIYSIKPELESIITSFRCIDIQSDIFNLKNLYSQIVDINSFSTNMKKLKEYISSVESHLRPMDSIGNSLRNIQKIYISTNLNFQKFNLEILIEEIDKNKSKLDEKDPVKKYIIELLKYINGLKTKVSLINEYINKIGPLVNELKKEFERINIQINCLKSDIRELECAIEGVVINFIRCSIQSISNHLIKIQDSNQNIDIYNNIKIYVVNNNLINNMVNTTYVTNENKINTDSHNNIK